MSRAFLETHLRTQPKDALAWALGAAIEFYDVVIDWMIGGAEITPGKLLRGKKLQIGDDKSGRILQFAGKAEEFARGLVSDPATEDMGYFALSISSGVRRDYEALVLGHWKASLAHAQETNLLGRKLLKANPKAHDAYCIFGWSEYLISRVPAPVRRLARIPGITGNRARAIQFCEVPVKSGQYYREFAMCLLVALYSEEGKTAEAVGVLTDLARAYPTNTAVAAELTRRSTGEKSPAGDKAGDKRETDYGQKNRKEKTGARKRSVA
ncbi:MAG TPA: hypothetical protein VGL82_07350 [Bryobacteraceae bacterium]